LLSTELAFEFFCRNAAFHSDLLENRLVLEAR
jgi:hypothetical protein